MHAHATLNRVYRLVWNEVLAAWVPAPETARARRKRAGRVVRAVAAAIGLTGLAAFGFPALAHAQGVDAAQLPTGGNVVAGAARIVSGNAVLDVHQSTNRAAIEWNTFDVGSGAAVHFHQPGRDAATLNRVLDSNPSRIFGSITADGQVFLTNPSGVYFGPTASVDVGGLVATTHGVDTDEFMRGNVTLTRDGATGSVVNDGTLETKLGGYVALLAPEVRNNGVVVAQLGTVAMAAGETVTLSFDGHQLAAITTEAATIATLVENRSAVVAPGGLIILSSKALDTLQGGVVRHSGTLEATGLSVRDGRIVLEGSGDVMLHDGLVDVSSQSGTGGTVAVTGDRVGLFGTSRIDASGAAGGGTVLVGGGFHGEDPSVANARQAVIGADAAIDASATQAGDGGKVAVWSDGYTRFDGSIAARGGAAGGDGGFVEVSGKENLAFRGRVDAGAGNGAAGQLLLDPKNIVVAAGGSAATTDVDQFADSPADDVTIAPDTITAVTNTGTAVTLQANNDITIASAIVSNNPNPAVNGGRGGDLSFRAGRSIAVNANIQSDGGNVSFTVNDSAVVGNRDAGTASFVNNSLIDAGSDGGVSITMSSGLLGDSGSITTGQVTAAGLSITHNGPTTGAESGRIDLGELNVGGLTIAANSARNVVNTIGDVVVHTSATINVGAGDVTIDRATTNFNTLGVTARNLTLRDTNAMRFAETTLSGNLVQTTVGPIGSTHAVTVAGTTTLTANSGGFGYADPYIDLTHPGNDFTGGLTLSVPSAGTTGTGGYALIRDSNALTITSASTARALTLNTGGAVTAATINAGTSVGITSTAGNIDLGTTTAGSSLSIVAKGAVNLGQTTLGTDLTIDTTGAITDSGTLIVPNQTILTAGQANDVTLDDANNNFNAIRIVSANNATLVDKNAISFGSSNTGAGGYTSHIYGDLHVTAGGDISQNRYADVDYAAITVDGATTFRANHASAPINLYLGPNDPLSGWVGSANNFAGGVTLERSHANTGFTNVQLRNINSSATVLAGLTSVGTLNNVHLRFDSAPAVTLPGMTMTGTFRLYAPGVVNTATVPGNKITQTGAIVVAGSAIVAAGSTGDIVLDDAGNDFYQFGIANSGARNVVLVDASGVVLHAPGYHQQINGDMTVTAGGNITDLNHDFRVQSGTLTLDAGTHDISLGTGLAYLNTLVIPSADDVLIRPRNGLVLGNVNATGTFELDSVSGGSLTQLASTAVTTGGNTTLIDFTTGITLNNANNVLGSLHIHNAPAITIRENDAITQSAAWSAVTSTPIVLTTSNDQAITLDQNNHFGNLTLTQINNGATSAGAVYVRETGDGSSGMTQGGAWTIHGTTRLESGTTSINLNNQNNILGALQVTGATGTTGGQPSTVTIYAKATATTEAITDVDGPGAWNTGNGAVRLVAYDAAGTTQGGGNVILTNAANVLGDLYVKATDVTITENNSITDGPSTSWNSAGDTGWVTTGTTNLVVANPTGKSITLDNLTNKLGPLGLNTTGTAGTLTSVLITDNTDLTQAAVWNVGTAPVTLDARTHAIALSSFGNVLGNLTINTANGTPTSVAITEDDAITQGSVWTLTGVPVTLVALNDRAITLTNNANVLGNLTITGGAVSITENDSITQSGAWTTTGTTTLTTTSPAGVVTLTNADNVLGDLAIGGTPDAVSITEDDDITQASAWVQASTPFTLVSGSHDIVLSQAGNRLGDLTLTGANATVVESDTGGITDGNAWTIPGMTTLTAGNTNPIVLNANPASDFGTVSIVSASNADVADANDIVFDTSNVSGTLTVTAGGLISQIGALTAPNLRLIGTGYASLTNVANDVDNLAAGFSGGDLTFVNQDDFVVAVLGGTSGVTIGANDVSLRSVDGTITGLTTINASSTSLTLETGTGLVLPQLAIAGAQTYTAGGSGITLNGSLTSTAAGAITFSSPVTLGSDLTLQTTNSDVVFAGTLAGATNQLTINAGAGLVDFAAAVSALGNTSDPAPALTIDSGGAAFHGTLAANNGLAIGGPVVFNDTVTLANGNVGSLFTGLVTLGKAGGMDFVGYDGITFNAGVKLQNGPATIRSNDSQLAFQTAGTVSGPYALTLDAGTANLLGLDRMGSDLTSLSVTAFNPTIPAGGISIAGPQTYTATNDSSIRLQGNVTSTAAGAITFSSPVTVAAASTVTSMDSAVVFAATVNGNHDLTVDAGAGTTSFGGAVGDISALGDGTGAALTLAGTGTTTFAGTVATRSGISASGDVEFEDDVTLGNGDTGSTFDGLVTTGGADGNTLSGHDGVTFNGGLALTGGPVEVRSNGSTLHFGDTVSGAQDLLLNALAAGAGTVTGLEHVGASSALTRLDVVAHTLALPATGLAVAGPMSFTAAGGITVNGDVGSAAAATGKIDFDGPVTLATNPITIETNDADVHFHGTVDGAQTLTIAAGTGKTTFDAAVGSNVALTSLLTDAGGSTALNGGSIRTTGVQAYNDAVTLGANTELTGVDVLFSGTLDGAYALTIDNPAQTTFGGVVGGSTPLTSITTDAAGEVHVETSSVTTTGAQTYNELVRLLANATFTGAGLSFGEVEGGYALTANATTGALAIGGGAGADVPLASLTASGNTIAVDDVATTGAQSYTAVAGVTLNGGLTTSGGPITITGPTTLGADVAIGTSGGNVVFTGATSTINGAYALEIAAGTGDVTLGGGVGGVAPLAGITLSGNNLTLPGIATIGDTNQTYTALGNITLNQSRTVNAPIAFTADADGDGDGAFILLNGVSLTASNNTLDITAADLDLQGNSTLSSGVGLMTIRATGGRDIALGGSDAAGQLTISGSELARIGSSGGLDLVTTGTGSIRVDGITAAQSQNLTGRLGLTAQGTGDVSFVNAASAFNALTANAAGGTINVGVDITTSNDAIELLTPVAISGASTIASGGGNITFHDTIAVDNDLTLTTGNGVLTFGGAVGSNRTLTLNLGGGSVNGLDRLESALTGLTVNGTAGITLPALVIAGPQVFNTGPITVTGNLAGNGIAFHDVVDVVPGSGSAITLDARDGTLSFGDLASFNAVDMTLIGDEIDFTRAVTGSGALALLPYTASRNVAVGNTTAIAGLNLTAAELAWLPIGTLASLSIGDGAGTGSLELAGVLNAPGTPLTLNGGGGITQTGGSIASGALTLYADGNAIALDAAGNGYGAVAVLGAPSALTLRNTLDITQQGSAGWALGAAPVTLTGRDIVLTKSGNVFGTLVLNGRAVAVIEADSIHLGASNVTGDLDLGSSGAIDVGGALTVAGDVSLDAAGAVTQSGGALAIGGNLDVVTSVAAGDVTIDNSGAATTTLGDARVGGDYTVTATGGSVSQASGTTLEVAGDLTVTGSGIVLGGANLVAGDSHYNGDTTDSVEIRQAGIISLGDQTVSGNLTVISERTNRSIGDAPVHGDAIKLDNAANAIGGRISVSASAPTVTTGPDVKTGIVQNAGTSISVTGTASFTAEESSAGSDGIVLTNAGNHFNVLQLSGTTIDVASAGFDALTIGSALATTSLTLTAAGDVRQSGAIVTPMLTVDTDGYIDLAGASNTVGSIDFHSRYGLPISFTETDGFDIAGLDANGGSVNFTVTNGGITQSGALTNVSALTAAVTGGDLTLTNAGNTIDRVISATATNVALFDSAGGLDVLGSVSATGDITLRTSGDLTLQSPLSAGGDIVVSTEGAGNFVNRAGAGALTAGGRWLVYSATPDLVAGAHTVKGGLTSDFRHYGAQYATYLPGDVTESGNGFVYGAAAPTLTVTAAISGAPTHVYGDTPTAALTYEISEGLTDSEDNIGNVVTGGTAAFDTVLADAMDAGDYEIRYTGGLTSAYTLLPAANGVHYVVTPAVLTYTADPASRQYGAASPVLSGSVSGFKLGQDASVLSGSAQWATSATTASNVGLYEITGSGLTAGPNYTFTQAAGNATAFEITRAPLVVTVNDDAKTYDGTLYSGGAGVTFGAFANGEDENVLGGALVYGGDAQNARNAGSYTLSASGLTSGNYAISYVDGTLVIGRADLTITAADVTKTYDGTLAAAGTAVVASGSQLFGGDTLAGGTFAFTDANAGNGNKTVTVGGVTIDDGNGGGNYNVSYVANTTSTIDPAALVVGTSDVVKTYDGTLAADGVATVVSGTLYVNASNGGTQDSLSGGTFAFTDANAGQGDKTVTVGGVTVDDGNGGGNYIVTYADNTTSTIERATVTFAGTIAEREYDGTTAATLEGYALSGLVGGETLRASVGAAEFADRNAGVDKHVTISGIVLADGTNGGLASNYVVAPTAAATGTITPRVLTLEAVVADRVYDGTTNAALQGLELSGFVGDETVSALHTGSAAFADKNVGNDKAIVVTGITLVNGLNGGLATNYAVPLTADSSASILPATLNVAGIVALDKVYDGTTTANVNTSAAMLTGVFGNDDVAIGSIAGTFADKNVGTAKAVTASTVELSGADAGNYVLAQPTGLVANIAPRTLVVTATGMDKVYDGTTAATVLLADDRIAGDSLTVDATAAFIDKNAGANKYVGVGGITLTGADAANYVTAGGTSTVASIARAVLDVQAAGVDRVYDGTTRAEVVLTAAPIEGDDVELGYGSAAFADKHVGDDKAVTVTGIAATGDDAPNYVVNRTAMTTADIYGGPVEEPEAPSTGNASLPPVTPQAMPTVTADTPAAVLDLTPPAGLGAGDAAPRVLGGFGEAAGSGTGGIGGAGDAGTGSALGGNGAAATAPALDGNGVSVSLVRSSADNAPGLVTVTVTAEAVATGAFSFELPTAVPRDGLQVSLADGSALPSWLRYMPQAGAFVATAPPTGALPLELRLGSGDRVWTVIIAVSAD